MERYGLARHVFVCSSGDYVVMLDVRHDRYFALDKSKAAPLDALVPGWPGRSTSLSGADTDLEPALVSALLQRGMITETPGQGKDATPVRIPPPTTQLVGDDERTRSTIRLLNIFAFFSAVVTAKIALRFLSFEQVICKVRRRKKSRSNAMRAMDIERIKQLVGTFQNLRVFINSSKNQCLYDSLVLLNFLCRYHVFPGWIFGVQACPFSAHCWVQFDDVVFNDSVEHAGQYTPIMLV